MFRQLLFAFLLSLFCVPAAMADCKANVFANYWSGDSLLSVNDVNTFCSQRANWFRVPASVPQNQYCFSTKETRYDSYGRAFSVYPTTFWYFLKSFSGYYQDDVLNGIHYYLRDFTYKGWPSEVKIHFDPKC